MRMICPECGAIASAAAWANDAETREVLAAIVKLPAPVAANVLPYLSLFRPARRALSWKRARKVVADLAALVSVGHVQIRGQVSRPCPATIWAQAMDEMVGRSDRLQRPLKNHNYLLQVAWPLADSEDRRQEAEVRKKEISGSLVRDDDDGLLPMEREMQRRGLLK